MGSFATASTGSFKGRKNFDGKGKIWKREMKSKNGRDGIIGTVGLKCHCAGE